MNQNLLIEVLTLNHLMRSPDEVAGFEQALEELAQHPTAADLPSLHLVLDDACEQPDVMFSLVHFLESFDVQDQVQAFIQVLPDLAKQAPEWTAILHSRMMNDAIARSVFEDSVRLMDYKEQLEIHRLLTISLEKHTSNQVAVQVAIVT